MQYFASLKPKNTVETIFAGILVLSLFSGWPQVAIGSNATLEPIMFGWILGAIVFTFYAARRTIRSILRPPWLLFIAWLVSGGMLALFLTDQLSSVLLRLLFLAATLLFATSLYGVIQQKLIRIDWVLRLWVALAIIAALLAVLQFLIGAFTNWDVLAEAYRVGVFQFPRVHLFAQEPQYFANWLLVPTLIVFAQNKSLIVHVLLSLALFLTLARGAFVALLFVLPILYFLYVRRLPLREQWSKLAGISVGLLIALLLVGFSTMYNSDKSFIAGVGRYLDHASLGIFNTQGANNIEPVITTPPVNEKSDQPTKNPAQPQETFVAVEGIDDQGVVEASTLGRLEVIRVGLDVFNDSPRNILIGVGLYRFGEEAQDKNPAVYSEKLITNNQYVQVLVETGLIGFVLYFGAISYALVLSVKKRYAILSLILIGLLVQFLFFSSYTLFPLWVVLATLVSQVNRTYIWQTRKKSN